MSKINSTLENYYILCMILTSLICHSNKKRQNMQNRIKEEQYVEKICPNVSFSNYDKQVDLILVCAHDALKFAIKNYIIQLKWFLCQYNWKASTRRRYRGYNNYNWVNLLIQVSMYQCFYLAS